MTLSKPIGGTQERILRLLAAKAAITRPEICDLLMSNKSNIWKATKGLVQRTLIQENGSFLSITDRGRAVLAELSEGHAA